MKKKYYIAGQISGLSKEDYTNNFNQAETNIRTIGHIPVNPLKIGTSELFTWQHNMKVCINRLMECDALVLLPNYYKSKGAVLEYNIAKSLDIPVYKYINLIKS